MCGINVQQVRWRAAVTTGTDLQIQLFGLKQTYIALQLQLSKEATHGTMPIGRGGDHCRANTEPAAARSRPPTSTMLAVVTFAGHMRLIAVSNRRPTAAMQSVCTC